jgi:16S rRNA G966 N2-methylase RsmD
LRENLKSLEVDDGMKVLEMDLIKGLGVAKVQFDIAFVDPPYEREDLYESTLYQFGSAPLLAPDGLLIVEHSRRNSLPDAAGKLHRIRSLVQGDAALAFYTS